MGHGGNSVVEPSRVMTLTGVLAAAVVLVGGGLAGGQEPVDPVGDLLDAHRSTGRLVDSLDGSAGQMLADELASSMALLIGELHLTEEVPQLTRVLARAGRERGYDHLAIEVGPVTARELERAASHGSDALTALARRFPFGFPFYDRRADAALLVDAVDAGYSLLGLDQEFMGSPRILLEHLEPYATSDTAQQAVEEWRRRELEALQRFMQSQDMSGAIMPSATPEQFDDLRQQFDDPAARRIVDEMSESAAIYQEFRRGENYRSNHHRIAWMKEHLRRYDADLSGGSRLLMKFGSVHMGRGYSPLNQLDLGNHVSELAVAAGGRSFHLITLAGRIRQADGSISEAIGEASYLRPLLDRAEQQGWTLFDLRPLRPHFHRDANRSAAPELAELVFRYDAVAMRQEMTESPQLR